MIIDEHVETVKFQKYAEKATTVDKRVELCKKYLEHKGMKVSSKIEPDVVPKFLPTSYQDTRGISRVQATSTIDKDLILDSDPIRAINIMNDLKRDCARGLLDEVMRNNLIKFDIADDMVRYQRKILATLYVWKEEKHND